MEGGVASCAEPLIEKTCQNKLGNNNSRFFIFCLNILKKTQAAGSTYFVYCGMFFFNGDFCLHQAVMPNARRVCLSLQP